MTVTSGNKKTISVTEDELQTLRVALVQYAAQWVKPNMESCAKFSPDLVPFWVREMDRVDAALAAVNRA